MGLSAENDSAKATKISALEAEIFNLKGRLTTLTGLRLKDIISRSNIEELFRAVFTSETGKEEKFNEIKDSPYFALLKYLVREGFIDETYSDYMTYFYENSLSRIDKVFLRSVTDKKAKDAVHALDNPQMVVSRLPVAYFEQEETLNYALFDFLLTDFTSKREFAEKIKRLTLQIAESKHFDFVLGYSEQKDQLTELVKSFGTEWTSFVADLFDAQSVGVAPANPKNRTDVFITRYSYALLALIGESQTRLSYLDDDSKKHLVEYLSKDASFLTINECDDQKVALGIKRLGIRFETIDTETARHTLLELVYKDNSYCINYENIEKMLRAFYVDTDIDTLQSANYSAIMAETNSPLSQYINTNIDQYMGAMLAKCGETITDTPDNVLLLLNNSDINIEKKITYISYLETTITSLFDVEDGELWGGLLENPIAIDYSAANVVAYFSMRCDEIYDDALVQYINGKGTGVSFANCFENDDKRNTFFNATIKTVSLSNDIYKSYLEQFKLYYTAFSIDSLPLNKLEILDELGKIKMSAESLVFMRENYAKYLYTFIVRHISEYIEVVSKLDTFLRDEMIRLLNEDISDDEKISLLKFEKDAISIKGESYSDIVTAHILQNNFNADDSNELLIAYSSFGNQTKPLVLIKATNNIANVLSVLDTVDRQLLSDLLISSVVTLQSKQAILKTLATNATDSEIKQWLPFVESSDFLALYDKNKRPRFENTDWNKSLLEIFKYRKLIKDYELSEHFGKFTTTRWGKGESKDHPDG